MGRLLLAVLVAAALVPAATGATARYPSSIVVLGHSGATGFGSDPAHPYGDAPANSWATGSNPAVDSLYSRILAVNPAVRGHAVNLAQDGATLTDLAAQIKRAVALKPKPELVVIQIGDNDILCDGNDASRSATSGRGSPPRSPSSRRGCRRRASSSSARGGRSPRIRGRSRGCRSAPA